MYKEKLNPIHPGEVLLEEFLEPMQLTIEELAAGISFSPEEINNIISHQYSITAEIALRLARFFGTSPQFWLGLQTDYDLDIAQEMLSEKLENEVKIYIK
ncbi:HigA family addiction module antitoxin [Crocosphaera sp. XPORK-15E]|uniref:HigA family addiction module antitoxin n=1 Tax=Crocosphaera sp. XPORK-15E TaxID=3110247 RepID=UPI002B1FAD16|nr:HigA family addiction module antitoxin [Crocosphaera sp. XPORK-15E]MEA5534971.1 HigA family addiction module antitoxin [Crocosphaera sp. XPORK-15E]